MEKATCTVHKDEQLKRTEQLIAAYAIAVNDKSVIHSPIQSSTSKLHKANAPKNRKSFFMLQPVCMSVCAVLNPKSRTEELSKLKVMGDP